MTIRFRCPQGHPIAVPDLLTGKKVRCPQCQAVVRIPAQSTESSSTGASAPSAASGAPPAELPAPPPASTAATASPPPPLAPLLPRPTAAQPEPPPVGGTEVASVEAPGKAVPVPPPVPPELREATDRGPPSASQASKAQTSPGESPGPVFEEGSLPPAVPELSPAAEALASVEEEPPEGYRPDPGKLQTVYLLTVVLGAGVALSAAPALPYLNLLEAPGWARVVLLVAALQLVYIAWMASIPDWSTVWIGMVVFALAAAFYGAGTAVLMFTRPEQAVPLDLEDLRDKAKGWCAAMLLLNTLMTYACGRVAGRWRRQYELARAQEGRSATAT